MQVWRSLSVACRTATSFADPQTAQNILRHFLPFQRQVAFIINGRIPVENKGVRNRIRQLQRETVPDTFIVPSVAVRARRREVRSGARQEVFSLALWQETGDLPVPDIGSTS